MKAIETFRHLVWCAMHDEYFARHQILVIRAGLLERGYVLPCDDLVPPHCWVINPHFLLFINPSRGWQWGFAPEFRFDWVRSSLLYQIYFVDLGLTATACPPPGYGDEEEW